MRRLVRAAFVIGRRDFAATVFSKAFLFFLLGPLFPVLLGALFGGIGAHVASEGERPVVAVIAPQQEFEGLAAAREELDSAVDSPVVRLVRFDPDADLPAQQRRLLASKDPPVLAVLSGLPDQPRLTGAIRRDGTTAHQVRLMIATAGATQAAEPPPPLPVTSTGGSSGSMTAARALTARAGQTILFLLTILLAGMLLSQLLEEKSNKIIEVLAAAVPIDAIFLGKLFAMLATSVLGIVVWTSAGAGAISLLVEGGVAALPPPAVGWPAFIALTVVYFGMNYLLLGAVFLGIGAQASTAREVQTLSMPVTMAQVVIFGFAATAVGAAGSPVGLAAAVFPLSSPMVMVAQAAERPDLWPHAAAIAWQSLWVALILHWGAKLFRKSVLKSGPTRGRSRWRLKRA